MAIDRNHTFYKGGTIKVAFLVKGFIASWPTWAAAQLELDARSFATFGEELDEGTQAFLVKGFVADVGCGAARIGCFANSGEELDEGTQAQLRQR